MSRRLSKWVPSKATRCPSSAKGARTVHRWLCSTPPSVPHTRRGPPPRLQRGGNRFGERLGGSCHNPFWTFFALTRQTRTSTGATPRAFIEQRRIERARALIEDTDQPLAEIAAATGFATQSHLTTAFRRATGFTPAAYRRGRRGTK